MSKRGVKRGGAEHNLYLAAKNALEEQRELNYWWLNRQFVLDVVVISLGQLCEEMGKTTEEIYDIEDRFSDLYLENEHDIAYAVAGEADEEYISRDKVGMTWVSKSKVDRVLKEYVRPEEFKSYDERFYDSPPQPYTAKDAIIAAQNRVIQKRDDEIVKLKGQIKLLKVKRDG